MFLVRVHSWLTQANTTVLQCSIFPVATLPGNTVEYSLPPPVSNWPPDFITQIIAESGCRMELNCKALIQSSFTIHSVEWLSWNIKWLIFPWYVVEDAWNFDLTTHRKVIVDAKDKAIFSLSSTLSQIFTFFYYNLSLIELLKPMLLYIKLCFQFLWFNGVRHCEFRGNNLSCFKTFFSM